jgi:hypothetical protein
MGQFSFIFFILITSVSFAEELELTKKNIEGQKWLFENGWSLITSPVEAWDYALQNHESSKEAMNRALEKISLSKLSSRDRIKHSKETMRKMNFGADVSAKKLSVIAEKIKKDSFARSSKQFQEAWKKVSVGYVGYAKTNEDDIHQLSTINKEFFKRVGDDFKDFDAAVNPVLGHLLEKSDVSWKSHFEEGKFQFNQQYEKSGTRSNSLLGLWDILVGHASWAYSAIFKPASKAAYQETKALPYYTVSSVMKTFIGSYNVVHSLGANLYYTSKLGYKIVSPSLESGYLASLALLNTLNGTVSPPALKAAGLINKVAVKTSAPLVAGSRFTIEESAARAQDAVTVIVHGSEAVGNVFAEKLESGVVLTYSALSQIPPQILLTAANSTIFLVYDGPRLILKKVSGLLGDRTIADVPVGSVLDLKKIESQGGKVEVLTEDPKVIKKVLEHVE